jgi:hypothetical protein
LVNGTGKNSKIGTVGPLKKSKFVTKGGMAKLVWPCSAAKLTLFPIGQSLSFVFQQPKNRLFLKSHIHAGKLRKLVPGEIKK